jgi:hypothetical protein
MNEHFPSPNLYQEQKHAVITIFIFDNPGSPIARAYTCPFHHNKPRMFHAGRQV